MELENLNRWHWLAIGLIVGLIFGAVRVGTVGAAGDDVALETLTQKRFETALLNVNANREQIINRIEVRPQTNDAGPGGTAAVNWVYGQITRPTRLPFDPKNPDGPRKVLIDRFRFDAAIPYHPGSTSVRQGSTSDADIRAYLADVKKSHPNATWTYGYSWWDVPANTMMLSTGGGIVLIGIIWPCFVGLLTGRGLFGSLGNRERRAKLAAPPASAGVPAGGGPTAEDEAHLAALEASLTKNLEGFTGHAVDEAKSAEAAPVRKLDGAPAPAAASAERKDEPKDFSGGQFYPVARPAAKKD